VKLVVTPLDELERIIASKVIEAINSVTANLKSNVNEEQLIDTDTARKIFVPEVSRATLINWTKSGLINCYKLGGRNYYKRTEVIESAKSLKPYKRHI
jgi:hypothetical protein